MTTEPTLDELRVKVAELTGWKNVHWYEDDAGPPILSGDPPTTYKKRHCYDSTLPEFPSDLNAMALAEATLTEEQHRDFRDALWRIIIPEADRPFGPPRFSSAARDRAYISASAEARARAFVATMEGK